MNWLAPHPDMMMSVTSKGEVYRIIREGGQFLVTRETRDGVTPLGTTTTVRAAKDLAEAQS